MAVQTLEIVGAIGDGVTPLTITMNLAAYGASGASPYTADSPITLTEDTGNLGVYRFSRTAGNSGTAGLFMGRDANGAFWHFRLEATTDTYFGSLDRLSPNLLNTTGAIVLPTIPTDWITANGIAADAIGASELAASAVSEIQSGLATSAALATVQADTDDIQTRLPAVLVSGRMDASVGAMAANTLTASALATDAVTEIQSGLSTYSGGAVASVTGNVGGNVVGSVASVVGAVGSVTGLIASNLDATVSSRMATYTQPTGFLAASFPTDPADQSLIIAATDAIVSAIAALNNLSQANVRTAVGLASANLDTQIGLLATAANLALAKADTAAVKLQTDKLAFTVTNQVDSNVLGWKSATAPAMTGDAFARIGAPAGASISADIVAVKTDTGNLVTRITSTLFSGITSLSQWLGMMSGKQVGNTTARTEMRATGAGGGTYDETTDSLESIKDNATAPTVAAIDAQLSATHGVGSWLTGSGAGTGARSVTITVNDGATALQNALIRVTQGAESYTATTNVSGVAVFALDDATWALYVTKPGYSFTPTTIIVNGTETATCSMTAVTVTPAASPGQTTCFGTYYDSDGVVEPGVVIDLRLSLFDASAAGLGYDTSIVTQVTDVNGYVEFLGVWREAEYEARRRGRHDAWVRFTTDDATTTALPVLIGDDDH